MDNIKQAYLNEDFALALVNAFEVHCVNNEIERSMDNFARYLLEVNLITDTQVNRYMCFLLFPKFLHECDMIKVKAIHKLEDVLNLKERHIWSLSNSAYHRFKRRKIAFAKRPK